MKKIGYDLEYAVQMNGQFVTASHLPIKGTKGHPQRLKNGGVEIDCAAVEITPRPCVDEDGFVSSITSLLNEVKAKYKNATLLAVPSVEFPEKMLVTDPTAMTMGCDPDFNAWTGRVNPRPNAMTKLRTFGGHIHIEGGDLTTIKACDLSLGMWSVLEDKDTRRRSMYGKAGAFRWKPYGVEYRTLSNFWCDREDYMRRVYRLTRTAQQITTDFIEEILREFGGPDAVQNIINVSDVDGAAHILSKVEGMYGT